MSPVPDLARNCISEPVSFPVGKVDFLEIHPMSFTEFLMANGDTNLAQYMQTLQHIEPLPDAFFNPLYEKLKMYFVTGGMPEAVFAWTQDLNVERIQQVLWNILNAYERDFAKHPNVKEYPKISLIWNSIPLN
jgi:predicted AAA+ superfamily ATPase